VRLNRLDLTRYGKFTDFIIDFGEKPINAPDLHIVYGPNEAGKSTTFSAIIDLLYGIEKRTKYDFKHPYNTMQIGGVVELNGRSTRFTRLKRDQQSLLDEHDAVVADANILAELGGIDRSAFQTMFSLNDDTLERGGESILASNGQLGELLFSASSGLASLSQRLAELRAEGDRFYKPRGSTHELAQYKRDLDALKSQSAALDVAASTFAKLIEAREAASEQYATAMAKLAIEKARLAELKKDLRAYPKYLTLLETRRAIDALQGIPDAPADWDEAAVRLQFDMRQIEADEQRNASNLVKVAAELETVVVDGRIFEVAKSLEDLSLLRSRYLSSEEDLPARRTSKAQLDGAIASALHRLGRPVGEDAGALLLKPTIRGQLDELVAERAQIDEHLHAAETEQARAQDALNESEADLAGRGATLEPLPSSVRHRLLSATEAVQSSDHIARKRVTGSLLRESQDQLRMLSGKLAPWTGEISALATLTVPTPGDLERWRETLKKLNERQTTLKADMHRLESTIGDANAQLSVFANVTGLVTDGEAQNVRRDREVAWRAHLAAMDANTANTFERAMRLDDEVCAGRLSRASDLARVNEISAQRAIAEKQLASTRVALGKVDSELEIVRAEIGDAVSVISSLLPANWSLEQLSDWLTVRGSALAALEAIQKETNEVTQADADGQILTDALRAALEAAGDTESKSVAADMLLLRAKDRIEADTMLTASATELARLRRDVQMRTSAVAAIRAKLEAWSERWTQACDSCWLGTGGSEPTPAIARQLFLELEALAPDIKARDELDYRIGAMEHDQKEYADRIAELVKTAGFPSAGSPYETDRALGEAIAKAINQAAAHEAAEAKHVELLEESKSLAAARTSFDAQLKGMCDHFSVASLPEVLEKLSALKRRRELESSALACEQDIQEILEVTSLDAALIRLKTFDIEAAQVDVEAASLAVENEETYVKELFAEKRSSEKAVDKVDADNAVAKLEEQKRTLLLEIEDGAVKWLRLKIGVAATEQALRLYREQHRSSLLVRASEAFAIVSRGAYTRLSTQAEKDGEVLVAVARDGSSKQAAALSKGTRFQLYLALRVAGYQDLVTRRQSVPFIADDILETFDDFRAEETLKVFGQMANAGQVIYLTHHKHLCDIACQVCPSVTIHDLQSV